jgi:hypothetical protein
VIWLSLSETGRRFGIARAFGVAQPVARAVFASQVLQVSRCQFEQAGFGVVSKFADVMAVIDAGVPGVVLSGQPSVEALD